MFCAASIESIMAELPVGILAYQSLPFVDTRVGYFGPFFVTLQRFTEKGWGYAYFYAFFTGLTTRAVYDKMLPSMDVNSSVIGVERFFSGRGTPAIN